MGECAVADGTATIAIGAGVTMQLVGEKATAVGKKCTVTKDIYWYWLEDLSVDQSAATLVGY